MKFIIVPALARITRTLRKLNLNNNSTIRGRVEAYICKLTEADKRLSKVLDRQLSTETLLAYSPILPTFPSSVMHITSASHNESINSSHSHTPITITSSTPLSSTSTHSPPLLPLLPPAYSPSPNFVPLGSGSPNLMSENNMNSPSLSSNVLLTLIGTMNIFFPDYDFTDLKSDDFEKHTDIPTTMNTLNNLFIEAVDHVQPGFRNEFWKAIDEVIGLDSCIVYSYDPKNGELNELVAGKLWAANYFFYSSKLKRVVFVSVNAVNNLNIYDNVDSDDDDEEEASNDQSLENNQSVLGISSIINNKSLLQINNTTTLSPIIAGVSIEKNKNNSYSGNSTPFTETNSTPFLLEKQALSNTSTQHNSLPVGENPKSLINEKNASNNVNGNNGNRRLSWKDALPKSSAFIEGQGLGTTSNDQIINKDQTPSTQRTDQ